MQSFFLPLYISASPYFNAYRESTKPMASINPAKFIREVRQEMEKVTWPRRKETMISTMMVLGLVTVAAVFFVLVDWAIGGIVRSIIGI